MPGGQRSSGLTIRNDLTELAQEIDFSELGLVGDLIAPPVQVKKQVAAYPVLPREAKMKVPDTRRQNDGSYARGEWNWEEDTYFCREFGFEEPIDNVEAMKDEEFIDHEQVSTELAVEGLLLGRESRVATALQDTSVWTGSSNTTAITNEWDDATNATPYADIDAAAKKIRAKSGVRKEQLTVCLSDDLVDYAILTDEVKNRYQYTQLGDILKSGLAEKAAFLKGYFGVKEVRVTRALYDTAGLASAASIGKFWSNEYIFVGKMCPPGSNLKTMGAIKQLVWTPYSNDYIVEDYEEEKYNRYVIRAREFRGIKQNTDFGHLLTNAKTTVSNGI